MNTEYINKSMPVTVWWTRLPEHDERLDQNGFQRAPSSSTMSQADGFKVDRFPLDDDILDTAIHNIIDHISKNTSLDYVEHSEIYTDSANVHTKYHFIMEEIADKKVWHYEVCAWTGDLTKDFYYDSELETEINSLLHKQALGIAKRKAHSKGNGFATISQYQTELSQAWLETIETYIAHYINNVNEDAISFALDAIGNTEIQIYSKRSDG